MMIQAPDTITLGCRRGAGSCGTNQVRWISAHTTRNGSQAGTCTPLRRQAACVHGALRASCGATVNTLRHTEAFLKEVAASAESASGDGPLADSAKAHVLHWVRKGLEAAINKDREDDDPKITPAEANARYGVSKRQLRRLENHGKRFKPLYAESDVAACRPRARQEVPAEKKAPSGSSSQADLLREQIRERRRQNRGRRAA